MSVLWFGTDSFFGEMTKEGYTVMLTCSFSGHRTVKPSHRAALPALLERAIEYAYGRGCRTFFTGGALGFDTYAARAVILFRIRHPQVKLVLLLPCQDQDARWSPGQRDAYRYVLSCADEVRYIAQDYTSACMRERNFSLAAAGDILICYVGREGSGSSQTRRMAQKMGKEVYNLYPSLEATE